MFCLFQFCFFANSFQIKKQHDQKFNAHWDDDIICSIWKYVILRINIFNQMWFLTDSTSNPLKRHLVTSTMRTKCFEVNFCPEWLTIWVFLINSILLIINYILSPLVSWFFSYTGISNVWWLYTCLCEKLIYISPNYIVDIPVRAYWEILR